MSIRKIKRRTLGLLNRVEIIRTFSLSGEYTGTWRVWRDCTPRCTR